MNNAEGNTSQAQQSRTMAESPAKTPATGKASPDTETLVREFANGPAEHNDSNQIREDKPLPDLQTNEEFRSTGDPVAEAASRVVSTDNANMEASDNTVDTDAKGLEARKDLPQRHDNVVGSNATLGNAVYSPAMGVGGIDSRPERNAPLIRPRAGWHAVSAGTTRGLIRVGDRTGHVIKFVRVR